jgi:ligand-binding sensor domain-containing protein
MRVQRNAHGGRAGRFVLVALTVLGLFGVVGVALATGQDAWDLPRAQTVASATNAGLLGSDAYRLARDMQQAADDAAWAAAMALARNATKPLGQRTLTEQGLCEIIGEEATNRNPSEAGLLGAAGVGGALDCGSTGAVTASPLESGVTVTTGQAFRLYDSGEVFEARGRAGARWGAAGAITGCCVHPVMIFDDWLVGKVNQMGQPQDPPQPRYDPNNPNDPNDPASVPLSQIFRIWDDDWGNAGSQDIVGGNRAWVNLSCKANRDAPDEKCDITSTDMKRWMQDGYIGGVLPGDEVKAYPGVGPSRFLQEKLDKGNPFLTIPLYHSTFSDSGSFYYRISGFAGFRVTRIASRGSERGIEGYFYNVITHGSVAPPGTAWHGAIVVEKTAEQSGLQVGLMRDQVEIGSQPTSLSLEGVGAGSVWQGGNALGAMEYEAGSAEQGLFVTGRQGRWGQYKDRNLIRGMGRWEGALWAATAGGVVRWESDGSVTRYTAANSGLVSSDVRAVAVGMDGALGFGTDGGISRHQPDGNPVWQTFTMANSGLASNDVRAVAVGADGALWVGTGAGISRYAPGATPGWQGFDTSNSGLASNDVRVVVLAKDGVLWFGTGGGISRYLPGTATWASFNQANSELASNEVLAGVAGADGSLWFGTTRGISRYRAGGSPGWENFAFDGSGLGRDYTAALAVGADGTVWASTLLGGVHRSTAGDGATWEHLTTATSGLRHDWISAVMVGPDGVGWFGDISGGVSRYTPGADPAWGGLAGSKGLASDHVEALTVGTDGAVWFGTNEGVSRYTPGDWPRWETLTPDNSGLAGKRVCAVAEGLDGSLWFGTHQGVSHYTAGITPTWESFSPLNSVLPDKRVCAVAAAPDGSLWFGSQLGVVHYTPAITPTWLSYPQVAAEVIKVGHDGSVWFGTDQGVSHYTPGATPAWEHFTTANSELVNNRVHAIALGNDGSLWFGTSAGVSQYTFGAVPAWQSFTPANSGLAAPYVGAAAVGPDGSLWFGTGQGGVSHFMPGGNSAWESLTTADGLVHNQVSAIAVGAGSLWFGTSGGANRWPAPVCLEMLPPEGVGIEELQVVASHWNRRATMAGWDERLDLDGDGDVDVVDLLLLAGAWGRRCG